MKINEAALKKLLKEQKNNTQTTPTPTSTLGMSEAEYNDFVNKAFGNLSQNAVSSVAKPTITNEQAANRASLFSPYSTSTGIEAALKNAFSKPSNQATPTPTVVPTPTSTLGMDEAAYNDFVNKIFSNIHQPEIPQAMITPTPTPEKTYMGLTESEYADAVKGILDNMPVRNPFGGFFGQKIQTPGSVPTTSNTTDDQTETVTPITEAKSEIKGIPNTISDDAIDYIGEQIEALGPQRNTQIGDLINEYLNRADFKYDPNADMLYRNYLAAMQNAGQMAMRDTMGQAAMLTGGYGSSYATAAANGAYNSYLQKANEALPDYYNIAANAYDRQGNDLLSQIQLLQNQDDEAYSRWLDQMKLNGTGTSASTEETWTPAQENKTRQEALSIYKEKGEKGLFEYLDSLSGYNLSDETIEGIIKFVEQYGQNDWEMTKDAWIPFPVARNEYIDSEGKTKTYSELEQEHKEGKISDEDWELIKSLTKKGQTTKDRR